jgi:Flp pilus assembly protein TadG
VSARRPAGPAGRGRAERGALGLFIAVLAPALIALLGLVYDGGRALEARQRGLDAAEQMARAAGSQCDIAVLRAASECVVTDSGAATAAADRVRPDEVTRVGPVTIEDGGHTVVVRTRVHVTTRFLALFGITDFDVTLQERRATTVTGLA